MIISLLKRITQALEGKNIPYMLSGGIAMSHYAVPRMTLNIDIVIELNAENQSNFLSVFVKGYYVDDLTVKNEIRRSGMFNVIDFETGFKVDFIVRKNSEYRKYEFQRRSRNEISDFEVWMVSLEDLIISKIEWIQTLQSDKQMSDIRNLLANTQADVEYIKNWCQKLKLQTFDLL
jgi:hypothetical protein